MGSYRGLDDRNRETRLGGCMYGELRIPFAILC
jgi:hypothetical protein